MATVHLLGQFSELDGVVNQQAREARTIALYETTAESPLWRAVSAISAALHNLMAISGLCTVSPDPRAVIPAKAGTHGSMPA